jgi:long-subunit fatty acid transport protein
MKNLFLVIMLSFSLGAFAQSDVDALRYSQTAPGGTSRSMGMGGAFGALGGDVSVLSTNPAGIAVYKRSELTFTPSLQLRNSMSSYLGQTKEDGKINFNVSNLGLVFTYNNEANEDNNGWLNFNFGFGYNKLNSFHNRTSFSGYNNSSSLIDSYLERVNAGSGTSKTELENNYPFDAYLAYQTYLINPERFQDSLFDPNHYESFVSGGNITQKRTSTTKGSLGEMAFSFGANYDNTLYLGATLGFTTLDYSEESVYEEMDEKDNNKYFKSLRYKQNISTSGSGFNLKLGAIYRPIDWFRVGVAYHTPCFYELSDVYTSTMSSSFKDTTFENTSSISADSPKGEFDYQLITPSRFIGSIAFIVGKKGLISADLETVNYPGARLSSADAAFDYANEQIKSKYQRALNFRGGAEYKINEIFSVRAGYGHYGNAFKSGADNTKTSYSGGFGIRGKGFFIDFAYIFDQEKEFYLPYQLSTQDVPGATHKIETSRIAATLGLRF